MFRTINIDGVTGATGFFINSIFQDEPVLAPNSGNTSPDALGVGTGTAQVRAERIEGGNGRVYTITFTAFNGPGGSCRGVVKVGVPATKKGVAVDDGPPHFDSTQP